MIEIQLSQLKGATVNTTDRDFYCSNYCTDHNFATTIDIALLEQGVTCTYCGGTYVEEIYE